MEIKKSESLNVELSKNTSASVYVHGWGSQVDLDFSDHDMNGTQHNVEVKIPLDLARELAESLVKGLADFDEKQAEKAAEANE